MFMVSNEVINEAIRHGTQFEGSCAIVPIEVLFALAINFTDTAKSTDRLF
jgi:hypothetical protein